MNNTLLIRGTALATILVAILPQEIAEAQVSVPSTAPQSVQLCLISPVCRVAVVILGGISYWSVTQEGSTTYHAYTEDPEGVSEAESDEWSDYIWADDLAQAERECRQYAETNGLVYVRVRATSRRGNRYECFVRPYA